MPTLGFCDLSPVPYREAAGLGSMLLFFQLEAPMGLVSDWPPLGKHPLSAGYKLDLLELITWLRNDHEGT